MFSLIWFGIILAHFLFKFTILNQLYSLNFNTYLIFFVGTICFTLGAVIAAGKITQSQLESGKSSDDLVSTDLQINIKLRLLILTVIIIGLPIYIRAAYRLFIASQIDDFFIGLRTELNYGDEDIGPAKYLLSLAVVSYVVNLYAYLKEKNRINRIIVNVCLVVTFTYAIFATGRLFFFMILTIYLGLNYLHNSTFSIKKYTWILALFLIFFMAHGIYYGKGGDRDEGFKENIHAATETLGVYLVSALSALDTELKMHTAGSQSGNLTLRFFIKLGQQFDFFKGQELISFNKDFVFVPYPTNVFTYYNAYIIDFGRLYAWFMLLIIGLIHTFFYNKATQTKNFRYSFYYSILLFPLVVSFFSDMYFSVLSMWIQIVFFGEMILLIDKIYKRKKTLPIALVGTYK